MKKIITLFLSMGIIGAVFAQSSREIEDARNVILGPKKGSGRTNDSKDIILGGDRRVYDDNGTRYPTSSGSSRNYEIERINREYNDKINSVRNNRYLSAAEKERTIRQLEADRARRIREVNRQYDDRRYDDRRRYDDDDRYEKSKNKKYKSNNGNHYGWEKGKGNPHKGKH